MKRILNTLFPLIDQIYIYQLLEYQSKDFLKWFLNHPFKRNLQRKQHIVWTAKAKMLFLISFLLILLPLFLNHQPFLINLLLFIVLIQISPVFIIIGNLIFKVLENVQKARTIEAAISKRKRLKDLKTIAIVGSFAKTSTKNILYTLLWKDFVTVKTPKSYNTELSIARTMLSDLKDNTEIFICEMDAYKTGEIERLCNIANPNMGIITAIGPQHLERFGSIEKLAKTQFELADYLEDNSVLFLNNKDEWSEKLSRDIHHKITFYNNIENFISDRKESETEQKFILHLGKEKSEITLPLKGEHQAINFLAAATIAHTLGVTIKTIQQRALLLKPTEHRLEIRQQRNITILDNTYNANPQAAKASLEVLSSFKDYQKIIITPGFVELGDEHDNAHEKFAGEMGKIADQIIIVGENAKTSMLKGLSNYPKTNLYTVRTVQEAMEKLPKIINQEKAAVLLENDLPDQYF